MSLNQPEMDSFPFEEVSRVLLSEELPHSTITVYDVDGGDSLVLSGSIDSRSDRAHHIDAEWNPDPDHVDAYNRELELAGMVDGVELGSLEITEFNLLQFTILQGEKSVGSTSFRIGSILVSRAEELAIIKNPA